MSRETACLLLVSQCCTTLEDFLFHHRILHKPDSAGSPLQLVVHVVVARGRLLDFLDESWPISQ